MADEMADVLASSLAALSTAPTLRALQLFEDLDMHDEHEVLEHDIAADIASLIARADGAEGDRVKYVAATKSMLKRWMLFVAVHGCGDNEPDLDMVKHFCGFMFNYRQRASRAGRHGLGDSMAEMAQYILAQVCTSTGGRGRAACGVHAACCRHVACVLRARCLM